MWISAKIDCLLRKACLELTNRLKELDLNAEDENEQKSVLETIRHFKLIQKSEK